MCPEYMRQETFLPFLTNRLSSQWERAPKPLLPLSMTGYADCWVDYLKVKNKIVIMM
jgi:hypothetical protein